MKLVTFEADGAKRIGAILGETVVEFQPALDAARAAAGELPMELPGDMRALLASGGRPWCRPPAR